MLKYKDTYFVIKEKDNTGRYSENKDDNYIKCKKGVQIYRYSSDRLVVKFNSNKYANLRIKELSDMGIQFKSFQTGDNEKTYIFNESNFIKVADIVKARKRIKKELTDEQREVLKLRLECMRKSKTIDKTI